MRALDAYPRRSDVTRCATVRHLVRARSPPASDAAEAAGAARSCPGHDRQGRRHARRHRGTRDGWGATAFSSTWRRSRPRAASPDGTRAGGSARQASVSGGGSWTESLPPTRSRGRSRSEDDRAGRLGHVLKRRRRSRRSRSAELQLAALVDRPAAAASASRERCTRLPRVVPRSNGLVRRRHRPESPRARDRNRGSPTGLRATPTLVADRRASGSSGRARASPRPLVHGPDPRLVGHDRRAPVREARDRDRGDRLAAPVDPRHGGLHLEPALPAADRAVLRRASPPSAFRASHVLNADRHGERGVSRVPARQTRPLAPMGIRCGGAVGVRAVDGPRRLPHVRGGRVPGLPLGPARDAARDRVAERAQRPAGGRGARPRLPRTRPVRRARARAAARGRSATRSGRELARGDGPWWRRAPRASGPRSSGARCSPPSTPSARSSRSRRRSRTR